MADRSPAINTAVAPDGTDIKPARDADGKTSAPAWNLLSVTQNDSARKIAGYLDGRESSPQDDRKGYSPKLAGNLETFIAVDKEICRAFQSLESQAQVNAFFASIDYYQQADENTDATFDGHRWSFNRYEIGTHGNQANGKMAYTLQDHRPGQGESHLFFDDQVYKDHSGRQKVKAPRLDAISDWSHAGLTKLLNNKDKVQLSLAAPADTTVKEWVGPVQSGSALEVTTINTDGSKTTRLAYEVPPLNQFGVVSSITEYPDAVHTKESTFMDGMKVTEDDLGERYDLRGGIAYEHNIKDGDNWNIDFGNGAICTISTDDLDRLSLSKVYEVAISNDGTIELTYLDGRVPIRLSKEGIPMIPSEK